MTDVLKKEILNQIINPICLHCTALGLVCAGYSVKDWRKAKGCDDWRLSFSFNAYSELDISDYLIGEDSAYGDRFEIRPNSNIAEIERVPQTVADL